MTVRTVVQTIGSTWVQLSDGTQTKTLQVLNGLVIMVDADEAPPANTKGHIVNTWMTITPPTKAWVKANAGGFANIAVS
jgi:hypothetical protein